MTRTHFRVLYREFLLRIIDLDLIAPQGDMGKLLGQFATILVVASLWITPAVLGVATSQSTPEFGLFATWIIEHFLIATTMLVVGLFAVLSWESMFPDRRDVLILSPLPLPSRTFFVAKIAAVAAALALSIGALNLFTGLAAPFAFASAPVVPPPTYDAPLPPVSADEIKSVLDKDLKAAFASASTADLSIAVLKQGQRRILNYGIAQPDSIYEIGSVSKTFTGLILARMLVDGKVRLDEPVRALLPDAMVAAPSGPEITLRDLVTHHSGLPGWPDNLNRNGYPNPGADYRLPDLYMYLSKRGVARSGNASFRYSNLGFGLLGTALARRAGTTYAPLLADEITRPLGLNDTTLRLTPEQRSRVMQAFNVRGRPIPSWDLDVLAPAGAIRSTPADMLRYLDAQLHPGKLPLDFSQAARQSQRVLAPATQGLHIAFAWLFDPKTSTYWHNGAISGYTSYAFFNPAGDYAGVVLYNSARPVGFANTVGQHLEQRLSGRPAVSIADPIAQPHAGLFGVLRSFFAYWFTSVAAGLFIFCSVLTLQGLAQLLPRQIFLRASSLLQIACFVALLTGYFWQAPFAGPDALVERQGALFWIPSYWFFGMFQQLNGPAAAQFAPLIRRAWMGLGFVIAGAVASYLIYYFRTLKKIVEQPDILPDSRRFHWLPPLGGSLETAVGQFAIRTLLRSRQHRVILSFYLGIGLGLAILFSKALALPEARPADDVWYRTNASLLVATSLLVAAAVLGARIVFSIPLEVRANWIFRVLPLPGVAQCLSAARRTMYVLAIAPVWLSMAVTLLSLWPLLYAIEHLTVLLLLAALITELCLHRFEKLPFTCTYLPGKSYLHMAFFGFGFLMLLTTRGAVVERAALDSRALYACIVGTFLLAVLLARWRTANAARSDASALKFEDPPDPALMSLNLSRDGPVPINSHLLR